MSLVSPWQGIACLPKEKPAQRRSLVFVDCQILVQMLFDRLGID